LSDASSLLGAVWRRLPSGVRRRLLDARHWARRNRPGQRVRWGTLRRTTPFSDRFALDRGKPVDRLYIEDFLSSHAYDVRGNVLEVSRSTYSRLFGAARVASITIVDIDPSNQQRTLAADLCERGSLPPARFDCEIVTQTLQYLPDLPAALDNLWSALAPGGVLLMTVPTLQPGDPAHDYWRFTPLGLRRILETHLPQTAEIEVKGYGNVLAGVASLYGLAVEDVGAALVRDEDPRVPVTVAARVRRPT
jgi:SAM-dependent methyltransferase